MNVKMAYPIGPKKCELKQLKYGPAGKGYGCSELQKIVSSKF